MIRGYDPETTKHHIVYADGDSEDLPIPSSVSRLGRDCEYVQDVRFSRKQPVGGCETVLTNRTGVESDPEHTVQRTHVCRRLSVVCRATTPRAKL